MEITVLEEAHVGGEMGDEVEVESISEFVQWRTVRIAFY